VRAVTLAAGAFVLVQLVARPFFAAGHPNHLEVSMWAVNAIALLALLATGGGVIYSRQVRALVNDEVARSHYRTAVVAGFWVAMATAMALYVLAGFRSVTAREAVYAVVTPSVAVALLAYAYLEHRAQRDG
jgi:cell division protein FtsW (lipid II flippase)